MSETGQTAPRLRILRNLPRITGNKRKTPNRPRRQKSEKINLVEGANK